MAQSLSWRWIKWKCIVCELNFVHVLSLSLSLYACVLLFSSSNRHDWTKKHWQVEKESKSVLIYPHQYHLHISHSFIFISHMCYRYSTSAVSLLSQNTLFCDLMSSDFSRDVETECRTTVCIWTSIWPIPSGFICFTVGQLPYPSENVLFFPLAIKQIFPVYATCS